MVGGDTLIELGNSWFSAKTIEIVRHNLFYSYGGGMAYIKSYANTVGMM